MSNVYSDFGNYSSHAFADRACNLIKNHDFDSKPIFMYVAFQNVHTASFMDNLQVPRESEDLFPVSGSSPTRLIENRDNQH